MVIIKAGFSGLDKTRGTEKAPEEIEKAMRDIFYNENFKEIQNSFMNLKLDNSNMETSFRVIEDAVATSNEKPIILGGDHSITYPAFKGFSRNFHGAGMIVFDAHPDLMDDFYTHEDYLRKLLSDKILKKENLILVGIRSFHRNELNVINSLNLKVFWMKQCFNLGVEELANMVMEISRKFDALYVSIDVDAIDPAFAPGTGYLEPGGFTSREFIYLVQRLKNLRNIQAMDIVEVNPLRDINKITVKLAAKIASEFQQKI